MSKSTGKKPGQPKSTNLLSIIIDIGGIATFFYFIFQIKKMSIVDPAICSIAFALLIVTTYHWAYPYWKTKLKTVRQKMYFGIPWVLVAMFFIAILVTHMIEVNNEPIVAKNR